MRSRTLAALSVFAAATLGSSQITLTAKVSDPGRKVSPTLYGIFFEEINRAGDGGIYAELIQNRSFEDAPNPDSWTLVTDRTGGGAMSIDRSNPLNDKNPSSLMISSTESGTVTVSNAGFLRVTNDANLAKRLADFRSKFGEVSTGIAIKKGEAYDLSLFARAGKVGQVMMAKLVSHDGKPLGKPVAILLGTNWHQAKVKLMATDSDPAARLQFSVTGPARVWLDVVSLFPKTWKGRPNGMRPDLMEKIAAIKPAFVRFPGGCFVEGFNMANAFRWKKTVGPIEGRIGHRNLWGYESTNGLGYHEYLQLCEDLKAEPLFVVNCGMAHENHIPMDQMGEYVQDAVDAIEYANGPVTSKWGALRAANGHPKPFGMKYLEIGNENGGPLYNERFALIVDAVKKKYPEIQLIANEWGGLPTSRPYELIDSHNYNSPGAFLRMSTMYDDWDRSKPYKVYFGEYAVTQQSGLGNLQAGVAEAALLTGFERNSDVVVMSSYAPLLSNEPWKGWNPNAIVFDQARVYGTPSYWVQTMFGQNRADRAFPVSIDQKVAPKPLVGGAGIGTYATQAEFKDLVVTQGDKVLYKSDLASATSGPKLGEGNWQYVDGALRQTGDQNFTAAMVGDASWSDYTLRVKARKISGREGFFVYFATRNEGHRNFWNLGGWDNTLNAIQGSDVEGPRIPGKIETGRWYDLRVEVKGSEVSCYLDDKFVQKMTQQPVAPVYSTVGKDEKTGEWILKIVNAANEPHAVTVNLSGAPKKALAGSALVMSGPDPLAENTFAEPKRLAPKRSKVAFAGPTFKHTLPANSVTILRLK